MIKIDASSVIPKRLGTYLLGSIPGLVFELSVAYADPLLAHQVIDRVRQAYPFQPYALLFVFAVSCLVVGQTFFLAAWFGDWIIDLLCRSERYLILHLTLGSDWLYKALLDGCRGCPLNGMSGIYGESSCGHVRRRFLSRYGRC
jgi:hypothetical protein